MERDEAKNLEVRRYFVTNRADESVRYYGTIGESTLITTSEGGRVVRVHEERAGS